MYCVQALNFDCRWIGGDSHHSCNNNIYNECLYVSEEDDVQYIILYVIFLICNK